MAVFQALQAAVGALRRNPSVVGVVVAVLLVQVPIQFAQVLGPTAAIASAVASVALAVLFAPFVFGGLIGMADEALDGTTSLGTFLSAGKRHYTSILGAFLLLVVGAVVFSFASTLLFGVVSIGVLGPLASGGLMGESTFGIVALLALVGYLLLWLAPLFFLQFYGQAIVVDGRGAFGGFKRSVGLVRRNLLSAFGYSVLVFGAAVALGLLTSIPSTLLSTQIAPEAAAFPELPLAALAALVVAGNVVTGLFSGFFVVFSVAFYRTLDGPSTPGDSSSARRTVA